ncbi:hypothetical protein UH38_10175 [Aliterella atlantica CENA595]|uniref:RNA-binding protein n=1 Tax=Aliterella atlantica CENA595 TaxID=1618023 RepID=A0A0D8ZSY6_9CYAN|nr:hypothetical protein UH38_10175 [Aliterella atlantica CENA595]
MANQRPKTKMTDYAGLVRFLIEPFLESTDNLSIDCETSSNAAKVWIRVAFEGEDKGRVFGRGGRNIQAIRTVLAAAAACSGHSAHLDIYGSQPSNNSFDEVAQSAEPPRRSREQQREPIAKPTLKLRSRDSERDI